MPKYLVTNSAYEYHNVGIITADSEDEAKYIFIENLKDDYGNYQAYCFSYDPDYNGKTLDESIKHYLEDNETYDYTEAHDISNVDNHILTYKYGMLPLKDVCKYL